MENSQPVKYNENLLKDLVETYETWIKNPKSLLESFPVELSIQDITNIIANAKTAYNFYLEKSKKAGENTFGLPQELNYLERLN